MFQLNLPLQNVEKFLSGMTHRLGLIGLSRVKFNQKGLHVFMFFSVSQRMVKIGLRSAAMTWSTIHPFSIISSNHQAFLGIIFFLKKSL